MKKLIYINNKEGIKSITHLSGIAAGNELLTLLNNALEYIGLAISEQEKESVLKDPDPVIIGNPNDPYQIVLLPNVEQYPNTPEEWKPIKERIKNGFNAAFNALKNEVKEVKEVIKLKVSTTEKINLLMEELTDGDLKRRLSEVQNTTFSDRERLILKLLIEVILTNKEKEAANG
jgi:hypothetical protein